MPSQRDYRAAKASSFENRIMTVKGFALNPNKDEHNREK
jgi:hypothetical protein